ncbi:MAG: hypothetical protein GX552_02505, partial [Chloroflexi bacterium]|nr:hypothetical protein [Chloroflexota bacterium]
TLRGTLPLDLPPGIHPVWVTNPEGQRSVLPSGIAWGQQLYLPRVMR